MKGSTCQLWNSLLWPIYVINSVDDTKLPYSTIPQTQRWQHKGSGYYMYSRIVQENRKVFVYLLYRFLLGSCLQRNLRMHAGHAVEVCWQSKELSVVEYASQGNYPTNLQKKAQVLSAHSNRLNTCVCTCTWHVHVLWVTEKRGVVYTG